MAIYKLTLKGDVGYDQIREVIVRAGTEAEARELVASSDYGDNRGDFARSAVTTCERVSTRGPAEILCIDVAEG